VASFAADLLRWEGSKPFMYADTRGFVTTGIGNKLGSAESSATLPWQHAATGQPATRAEVRAAFEKVEARYATFRAGHPDPKESASARYYERTTDLVLPAGSEEQLAIARLDNEFLPGLRRLFPSFEAYPPPAQRALVDMVYTLGVKGLETKFPTLVAACQRGDFVRAANNCHRKAHADEHHSGDARNIATKNLFLDAAVLTASVQTLPREVRL